MLATTLLLKEGRYNIEQEFSAPDSSARFQAFDTVSETAVTIVEVPLRLPKVATTAQREALNSSFKQQAVALESFSHRAVSTIRDHFSEGGRHYVVTDLIDGLDLDSSIENQKRPFSVSEVVDWADAILDALNVLHVSRPPIFFRALKPATVVLKADRSISLLMSAALICGEPTSVSSSDESVSYSPLEQLWNGLDAASQKVIINKYDEASERILKQDLDARTDIYSLGATLYHLVTARRPVDVLERSIEIIEGNADPLKSPHSLDPAIPTEVSDVIMKAMEIKREYRFDSAAIMRQVLKTAMVRVKEREAEESFEQEEAAALIQQAKMERQSANGNGKPADEDTESVLAKLREAEEKRLEAERRAAQAEKKLRETEARVTESFNLAELDDDLLGLLAPHTSDAPESASAKVHTSGSPDLSQNAPGLTDQPAAGLANESVALTDEPVETTELPVESVAESFENKADIEEVELREESTAPVIVDEPVEEFDAKPPVAEETVAEVLAVETEEVEPAAAETIAVEVENSVVEETPVEAKVQPAVATTPFKPEPKFESYADVEPSRSGLPIPALAAAAAVLLAVVVGGWVFLGSSSSSNAEPSAETQTTAPAPAAQTEEPSRTSYQPEQQSQPPATQTGDPNVVNSDPNSPEQPQKLAAAGANQPKKKPTPAPAKSPAQKKAVTADDLINDN